MSNAQSLTTIQAAQYLGISASTLGNWRWKGTGPRFTKTNSGLIVYQRDDIEAWKAQHEPAPTPENGDYHESYLIGALLKAPEKLDDVSIIELNDINNPNYRIYLEALHLLAQLRGSLTLNDLPAVIETVARLTHQSEPDVVGMVTALTDQVYSTANLLEWAIKVKRAAQNRQINRAMKSGDGRKVHDLVAEQDRLGERLKKPALKSRFVWADEFCALPPTENWSIKDYFEPDTLCVMYGDSEAYKSFLAVDIACHIATGKDWRGKKVKQGIALYIAGEGGNGLRKRIKAWFEYYGEPIRNIAVSTVPLALCDPANVVEFVAHTQQFLKATAMKPTFMVTDTLNTHFGDGDENNTADMTRFMAGLRTLRMATSATIFIPHHCGLAAKDRSRGSIVLHNGIDWEYRLERRPESQTTTLTCTKVKDHEKPELLSWNLETVPLSWADEEGQPLYSAVLIPNDSIPAVISVKEKSLTGMPKQALNALQELYRCQRETLVAGGQDPHAARVTISQWNDAMQSLSENKSYRSRIRSDLEERGYVRFEAPFVYLTPDAI